MKTFSHLWQYLAELVLDWEMFQIKVVEKIKIHFMFNNFFSWKLCRLWDYIEKCSGTEGPQTWRVRVACWISRVTRAQAHAHAPTRLLSLSHTHAHTHREMWYSLLFVTSPQRYVIRTLPVFFCLTHCPRQEVLRLARQLDERHLALAAIFLFWLLFVPLPGPSLLDQTELLQLRRYAVLPPTVTLAVLMAVTTQTSECAYRMSNTHSCALL